MTQLISFLKANPALKYKKNEASFQEKKFVAVKKPSLRYFKLKFLSYKVVTKWKIFEKDTNLTFIENLIGIVLYTQKYRNIIYIFTK